MHLMEMNSKNRLFNRFKLINIQVKHYSLAFKSYIIDIISDIHMKLLDKIFPQRLWKKRINDLKRQRIFERTLTL